MIMKLIGFLSYFYPIMAMLSVVFFIYQMLYIPIGFLRRSKRSTLPPSGRRYAVLISARNEEEVIGELVDSLKKQTYPQELLDVYVVADNCTDRTAQVAQEAGALVTVRHNKTLVGKGYALDCLVKEIWAREGQDAYAGYFVFDADNIVDPNFVSEMDKMYDPEEYAGITGYRNSKNFGQNWITAGYSIWFLREARFLNNARMALGTSCTVSGTGFLVNADALKEAKGWPWHLLTEDIQFSTEQVCKGRRIGYCDRAFFYDEQPATFRQAWTQRERWSKGFLQVSFRYIPTLLKGMFRGGSQSLSCYDLTVIVGAGVLTLGSLGAILSVTLLSLLFVAGSMTAVRIIFYMVFHLLSQALSAFYMGMLGYGLITVICEWKMIRATTFQKLIYLVTFPIFMLTYLPITVSAAFRKVEWKPIRHTSVNRLAA